MSDESDTLIHAIETREAKIAELEAEVEAWKRIQRNTQRDSEKHLIRAMSREYRMWLVIKSHADSCAECAEILAHMNAEDEKGCDNADV